MACALLFSTFCIQAKSPTSDSKAKNLLHISLKFWETSLINSDIFFKIYILPESSLTM